MTEPSLTAGAGAGSEFQGSSRTISKQNETAVQRNFWLYVALTDEERREFEGMVYGVRNSVPRLLAIAAAAKEVAACGWGTAAKMPESYHFERIAKMEALRAALDSRAGAAPASGDGSIGGGAQADAGMVTAPRSLSSLNPTGKKS